MEDVRAGHEWWENAVKNTEARTYVRSSSCRHMSAKKFASSGYTFRRAYGDRLWR